MSGIGGRTSARSSLWECGIRHAAAVVGGWVGGAGGSVGGLVGVGATTLKPIVPEKVLENSLPFPSATFDQLNVKVPLSTRILHSPETVASTVADGLRSRALS